MMSASPKPEKTPGTHEYLSVKPQVTTPRQMAVFRQKHQRERYSAACCWSLAAVAGSWMRTSASVIVSSSPRLAMRAALFTCAEVTVALEPLILCHCQPTPSMGTPRLRRPLTRLKTASDLAPEPSAS